MNILNEEIRSIRTMIEAKRKYLKENEQIPKIEADKINESIIHLKNELESRLEELMYLQ